jgi:hypothetical protein
MQPLTTQNFDRLAKALMYRHGVPYHIAQDMLAGFRLGLVCGEEIRESAALQAAVLTAINSGKRAFRGGVEVELPIDVASQVPWPGALNFNQIVESLGARISNQADENVTGSLLFGDVPDRRGTRVLCDGWRAALAPPDYRPPSLSGPDFALGGVFAGGFGVARAFLAAAQISHRDVDAPIGISLWRPDLPWFDPASAGPELESLPAKLWLLGLGHLGQAYAWTVGLLPFDCDSSPMVYLQDFDAVEDGNWSAGLLSEPRHVGRLKTRVAAQWLEERGCRTRLIERPFDLNLKRGPDEPRLALCGFDNPQSRQMLEEAGFELIIDTSLGATLDHFDRIVLRTFPEASQKPREIWATAPAEMPFLDAALFEQPEAECGILLEELAGKAISSSFVGACASALSIGEALRAQHAGYRCEFVTLQLRDLELPRSPYRDEHYQLRVARNGSVPVSKRRDHAEP